MAHCCVKQLKVQRQVYCMAENELTKAEYIRLVKAARENAKRAGVDGLIHFQQRPVHHLSHPKKYGFVITNPPYGERLEEKEDLPALYRDMGKLSQDLTAGLSMSSLLMKMQSVTLERKRQRTERFITE